MSVDQIRACIALTHEHHLVLKNTTQVTHVRTLTFALAWEGADVSYEVDAGKTYYVRSVDCVYAKEIPLQLYLFLCSISWLWCDVFVICHFSFSKKSTQFHFRLIQKWSLYVNKRWSCSLKETEKDVCRYWVWSLHSTFFGRVGIEEFISRWSSLVWGRYCNMFKTCKKKVYNFCI